MAVIVVAWIFWEIIYIDVCRLEPYHQLTQPGGTTVAESLSIDYATTFTPIVPFVALRKHSRRHYSVTFASIIYMLSSTVLPIVAAAMFAIKWVDTSDSSDTVFVKVDLAFVYCTLAASALTIICGMTLMIMLSRRKTRLYGKPASIGGIAAMIAGSDILSKFKTLRSYDNQTRIDEVLDPYHVQLDYKDGHDNPYQICLCSPLESHPIPLERRFEQNRADAHSWWLWGRSFLVICGISTIPTFVYLLNSYGDASVDIIVAKLCFTAALVVKATLASNWRLKLGIMEPFYRPKPTKRLSTPPTSSTPTSGPLIGSSHALNLSYSGSPIVGMFQAMSKGGESRSVWLVSFYVLLLQLSVIYAPSMANNQLLWYIRQNTLYSSPIYSSDGFTMNGYYYNDSPAPLGIRVNSYVVLIFTTIQAIFWVCLLLVIMRHKRKAILPRRPHTLSSIILYLCYSKKLLDDLKGTSTISKLDRDALMAEDEWDYAFGWIQPNEDESAHLAIERVDEIKSQFEYGKEMVQNAR